jgi:hypothetical protein
MNFAPFAFQQQRVTAGPVLPTIITTGLVIYVNAFDTLSYPGTGTTWSNLVTGVTATGTLYNSPTFNSSQPSNISFDGVDDYVYFGNDSEFPGITSQTWGGWVKFSSFVNSQSLFNRGNDVTGQAGGWSVSTQLVTGNKIASAVVANSQQRTATSTTTFSTNTWYYIVGTWQSGNSVKLYVNGNLEANFNTTATTLRTAFTGYRGWYIARGTGSTFYRNEQVSLFHLYSRTLAAGEILNNFNSTKQYYGY